MAKAKAEITISQIIDIKKITRYYILKSSTTAKPDKPTTNPPIGWTSVEPAYTSDATNTLYFVDLTEFTNGESSYSEVSKSSSYEAAKEANTKITEVKQTADKINWLVKSGTSESNMQLTDKTYNLMAENITLKGDHIQLDGDTTIGDGFKLMAGNIDVDNLFAQDINATGTINGVNLTGASGKFTKEFDVVVPIELTNGAKSNMKIHSDKTGCEFGFYTPDENDPLKRLEDTQAPFALFKLGSDGSISIEASNGISINPGNRDASILKILKNLEVKYDLYAKCIYAHDINTTDSIGLIYGRIPSCRVCLTNNYTTNTTTSTVSSHKSLPTKSVYNNDENTYRIGQNGIEIYRKGYYLISGSAYFNEGINTADTLHMMIYRNTNDTINLVAHGQTRAGGLYECVTLPAITVYCEANAILSWDIYNQTRTGSMINSDTYRTFLNIVRVG